MLRLSYIFGLMILLSSSAAAQGKAAVLSSSSNSEIVLSYQPKPYQPAMIDIGGTKFTYYREAEISAPKGAPGLPVEAVMVGIPPEGNVPRAPKWIRAVAMEWFYRFLQDPKRLWKRYIIGNVMFLLRIIGQKFGFLTFSPNDKEDL